MESKPEAPAATEGDAWSFGGHSAAQKNPKPSTAHHAPSQSKRMACIRSVWRLTSFFLILGLVVGLYIAIAVASVVKMKEPFSKADTLAVRVSGCDVLIKPGDTAEVVLERYISSGGSQEITYAAGTSTANFVEAVNKDCSTMPRMACTDLCSVTIYAPQDTNYIRVTQRPDDENHRVRVVVEDGVTLDTLEVKVGFANAGPSIEAHIGEATIRSLNVRTDAGSIFLTNTLFTSADLRSTRGSIIVRDTKHPTRSLTTNVRQMSNAACFKGGSLAGGITFAQPWSPLDDRQYADTVKQFDENRDFFVTVDEFGAGLSDLGKCCGSACPFRSWCASLQYRLFPSDSASADSGNGLAGRSGIVTDSLFMQRLVQFTNETMLVPRYYRQVSMAAQGSTASASLLADAKEGEVRVEFAPFTNQGSISGAVASPGAVMSEGSVPAVNAAGEAYNYTYGVLPDSPTGIKLLKSSADRLVEEIQGTYGTTDSVQDVFATLDVEPSPGIPGGRWVYTTRPFFLNLDPAYLTFLSAGLLAPAVKHYRVAFTQNDCDENATRIDAQTGELINLDERLKDMYEQLYTAITPRFQLEMRGVLAFVHPNHLPPPASENISMFVPDFATGGVNMRPLDVGDLTSTRIAVLLSIALGAFTGLVLMYAFVRYMRVALRRKATGDRVKAKILALQLEGEGGDARIFRTSEAEAADREAEMSKATFNPLETPLELVELLVVNPLRRRMFHSVRKFIHEKCKVEPPAELQQRERDSRAAQHDSKAKVLPHGGPPSGPALPAQLPMSVFMKYYTQFCFRNDLVQLTDVEGIRRTLIGDFDLRVQQRRIHRVLGMRYKEGLEVMREQISRANPQTGQWPAPDWEALTERYGPKPEAEFTNDMAVGLLQEFVKTYCEPTPDSTAFLRWSDQLVRSDKKGGEVKDGDSAKSLGKMDLDNLGFYSRFDDFCEVIGWEEVPLSPATFQDAGFTMIDRREKIIHGLSFLDFSKGERARIGWRWFGLETLTVFVHLVSLIGPPCVILVLALQMQYNYAATLSTVSNSLTWIDVARWPLRVSGRNVIFTVTLACWFVLTYMGLALLRVLLHYIAPKRGCMRMFVQKSFAFVLIVVLYATLAYLSVVGAWFLLAALVDPTRFLPYGVAVATMVMVGVLTWKQLLSVAVTVRKKVKAAFSLQMERQLTGAKERLETEMRQQRKRQKEVPVEAGGVRKRAVAAASTGGGSGDAVAEGSAGGKAEKETAKTGRSGVDIGEIFDLLDASGDEVLDTVEFNDLFVKLDLKLSKRKQDQMFAYCDKDSSGTISREELVEAWEFVENQIVAEAAAGLGLSNADIALAVLSVLVILGLALAFIFVAIKAFNNLSSFDSVIQSLLVSGTGVVMQRVRRRPPAETADPEDLDGMIDGIVDEANGVDDAVADAVGA